MRIRVFIDTFQFGNNLKTLTFCISEKCCVDPAADQFLEGTSFEFQLQSKYVKCDRKNKLLSGYQIGAFSERETY